jgi:dTDP-4-amino-4,6-dideoxygalactose transaminase
MESENGNIVLFYPNMPENALEKVVSVLKSRWIGQGPLVDLFESEFSRSISNTHSIAVGSGTDALHLAYLLAGIQYGDEVLTPVFTCTATNIPLLYIGAKPIFVDIDRKTMNIEVGSIEAMITERTKAIVAVDYGGLPCDYYELRKICDKYNLILIGDSAHALGSSYREIPIGSIADFTIFSFQAIKHITTGDGGMLCINASKSDLVEKAKRLRWFGINRQAKKDGIWSNDITEIGYKYQMTDISAAIGLASLESFPEVLNHRQKILQIYFEGLRDINGLYNIGQDNLLDRTHSAWLHTILVENREGLIEKLRRHGIETAQVHYRNDGYSIFGNRLTFKNMDYLESRYLVLPIHTKMNFSDADRVVKCISSGW